MERREEGEKKKVKEKEKEGQEGRKQQGKVNVREKAEREDGFQAVSLGGPSSLHPQGWHPEPVPSPLPAPLCLPLAPK